ncbi:MAG: VOC family protein [Thermoplasmata archaeon]|nr:MAG: VOC family protein [Thermoplasmata archaeon]
MEKSKKFYTSVFDWKINVDPKMNYGMIDTGEEPGGGLFQAPPEIPLGVTSYILVDSIEGTLEKIQSEGGKVIKPKSEIPGMGWFALFMDPEENVLGIYETMKKIA